tara:strand:- start:11159 stop:14611 length:3453 start_codon:yes stop_codon:yes gene_type:complete
MYAFSLVALMLLSISASFSGLVAEDNNTMNELADESVQMEATSPGHPVFTEYVGAHWCGPCHSMSANLHTVYGTNGGGGSQSEDFTYISFWESATTGWPADAPINRRSHISPSYYPTAVYGDAPVSDTTYYTSNRDVTSLYEAGGDMGNTNDYSMRVVQSQNGNNMDIDITATYTGSGSKTVYIYAAVTEATSPETYSGSPNPHPHHVFQDWLLNPAGTGFESVTLTSGNSVTKSWSKPISTVRAAASGQTAADNFLTVGALLDGDHTTNRGVVSASDSNMGPKVDIGITSFAVSNPASSAGYVRGDTITLEATVKNLGDLDYTDGGNIEFYHLDGNTQTVIDTSVLSALPVSGSNSLTLTATVDTTNFDISVLKKVLGAQITGLTGDSSSSNNVATFEFMHDRPPITKSPQVTGEQTIDRNSHAIVLAKSENTPGVSDFVDDVNTTTFNVEVSPTGQNQWFSSVVSGGQDVVYPTTNNQGREYVVTPTSAMSAGWYDVRTQAVDSRGQTGDWKVITGSSGFELANGAPTITPDPAISVMCDTLTRVSMDGYISDPETPLQDLIITSSDESFVAWHAVEKEIEVKFQWSETNGCPLGPQGIEISMDDGSDYSQAGQLPYGTLNFLVTENGQPRWNGLPTQSVTEGGSGVLALLPFLSDTDDNGADMPDNSHLTLKLMGNSNEDIITATLVGNTIGFETVDDDVNGQTVLTLRASDGVKTSEATLTINIDPVNDAPRIIPFDDLASLTLKRNTQFVVDLDSRIVDIDDTTTTFVRVSSSEPGAARYSVLDGTLTLSFEETGAQTVSIIVEDGKISDTYVMQVEVFDAYPFLLTQIDDGTGYMFVSLADTYIGQTPTVTMMLTDDAPTFTYISARWNICSDLTGTCDGLMQYDLDISKSNVGWTTELLVPSVITEGLARADGSQYMDYYELSILANDGTSEFKTMTTMKWEITEDMPAIADMDDTMFTDYITDLEDEKLEVETQIASSMEGAAKTLLEAKLVEVDAELTLACDDPRATCVSDAQSDSNVDTSSIDIDMQLVGIIGSVVLIGVLLTLMITRRRGKSAVEHDAWNDTGWSPNMVPAHDSVANSMYGGAQNLFQQPVAIAPVHQPAAPAPAQQIAGPPLPPGGLPAGWTAEQWAYYGQQYLDGTL